MSPVNVMLIIWLAVLSIYVWYLARHVIAQGKVQLRINNAQKEMNVETLKFIREVVGDEKN